MAIEITMKLWRDVYNGPASMQYSWVPEGKRRMIQLSAGQQTDIRTDTVDDDLDASHVQIYCLDNDGAVSTAIWQFPLGPPNPWRLTGATVEIFEDTGEVLGTAEFLGHDPLSDKHQLENVPRKCPDTEP